jgi:hypothetical protein
MNISGMISKMKQRVRERQSVKAEKTAQGLKALREERVRVEGQKKIYDLQAQEQAKLRQAKNELMKRRFDNSGFGKVANTVIKNVKEQKAKPKREAPSFVKSGQGMFGEQPKSPYALQRDEPKKVIKSKPKKKIIIQYE